MSLVNIFNKFYNKFKSNKVNSVDFDPLKEVTHKDLKKKSNSVVPGLSLEDLFLWSGEKTLAKQRSKLRRTLAEVLYAYSFIVYDQISAIVTGFLKELKDEEEAESNNCLFDTDEFLLMPQPFVCKCGWLLFNPATLPCGHSMCKHCIDEKMFCTECGYTLESPCNPNTFLTDIISRWFSKEYKATSCKKIALEKMHNNQINDALDKINESLFMVSDDYTALSIRSEIYTNMHQHKDALRDSELACKLNPTDGKIQFRRGECYSNLSDLNNAIDAFQLCLELEPNDVQLSNAVIQSIDKILAPPDPDDPTSLESDSGLIDLPGNDNNETDDIETKRLKRSDSDSSTECSSEQKTIDKNITDQKTLNANLDNSSTSVSSSPQPVHVGIKKNNMLLPTSPSEAEEISNQPCCSQTESTQIQQLEESHSGSFDNSIFDYVDEFDSCEKVNGVPKHLINEEDFECKLCYDLLYKPVTTPCGHIFCKNCVVRTIDHNPYCPICRVSLKDYLAAPHKPVTVILVSILEIYFKEQLAERDKVYKERLEKLSRVGIDEDVEIPVMVCSIAFPYVSCPLHIFEPKYRLMIRDCFESGSRKFGMCIPKASQSSEEEFSEIGTICEITRYQCLPDGRYIIHTVAGQRFTITSKRVEDSLYYAKVKYFCDAKEDLSREDFASISRTTYDHLSYYVNSLKTAEQDCIFNALGQLPKYEDNYTQYQHGVPWVWWGLAAIPLNLTAKLVLLRSKCITERMRSLQRFLRFLTRLNPTDKVSEPVSS